MTAEACRVYLRDLQKFGVKLGLDNVRILLSSFDDPQKAFPSIHVAGTNGKGSVCAMLTEILSRRGLRVGLYTSPHLVRLEERIRVGGRMILAADLRRLLGMLKSRIEELTAAKTLEAPPTFFEVVTALAFLHFREKKVDLAVLEVGMGGRFDATNVVLPLVSVITTVAKDHMEHLGNTRRRAAEDRAPLFEVFGRNASLETRSGGRRPSFLYRIGGDSYRLRPALLGTHQGRNAAVAVVAARVLGEVWRSTDRRTIEAGIKSANWEGRLEEIGRRPRVFLDGAHNEAGVAALAAFIREICPRPPVLVFVMMKDKTIARVARVLFPAARKIILTTIPYKRAAAPEEIRAKVPAFEPKFVLEPDLRKALTLARRLAGPSGTVFVTGSLFLVGEVKKIRRKA
jgi:dihydrofolate synthase/folylpolyglutamate synthase